MFLNAPLCSRPASGADAESFENSLEQQLENELKLEDLMKHRPEPEKSCMVSGKSNKTSAKL